MIGWEEIREFSKAAISIFAIVNPVGALPLLMGITEGEEPRQRKRLVRVASVAALAVISVTAVAGDFLMETVFQVHINQFTLGGGILLIVFGIRNMLVPPTALKAESASESEHRKVLLAVSPIACPLLVGPGAIVTAMLISRQHSPLYALGACLAAFVFVALILNFSHVLYRVLGPIVTLAVGRILQIFIVAIGTQFIVRAVLELFPALGAAPPGH
jgi:multiple antibiotic resistance protein